MKKALCGYASQKSNNNCRWIFGALFFTILFGYNGSTQGRARVTPVYPMTQGGYCTPQGNVQPQYGCYQTTGTYSQGGNYGVQVGGNYGGVQAGRNGSVTYQQPINVCPPPNYGQQNNNRRRR